MTQPVLFLLVPSIKTLCSILWISHQTFGLNVFPIWTLQYGLYCGSQSGLQIHISFCLLAHCAYLHKHTESLSNWLGQSGCQTWGNLSTPSFLSRRPAEKEKGGKKTSIANYPWILCSGRFRNLFCRLLIIVCVQNIYQVPGDHNRHKPSLCLNVPSTEPFQSPDTYNRVPIQQEDGCSLYCVCKFCLTYH